MDLQYIKNAFYEDAAGTSATPANAGPGSNSQGIAPFKARLGTTSKRTFPETVTEETHEDVFLNEDRITYEDMPITPFSGLDNIDITEGIKKFFQGTERYLQYNLKNTNIENKDLSALKNQLNNIINKSKTSPDISLNLGDVIQLSSMITAIEDSDDFDENPKNYLLKVAQRRFEAYQREAFEEIDNMFDILDDKGQVSIPTVEEINENLLNAFDTSSYGKVIFWQKLKSTIENFKRLSDESNNK